MKTFSIKEALRTGWALFNGHRVNLVLATLVFLIVSNLQNFDLIFKDISGVPLYALTLLFALVSTVVSIGWYKFLLRVIDGGTPDIKELFVHASLFWKYFGALILLTLVVGAAALIGAGLTIASLVGPVWVSLLLVFATICLVMYVGIRYSFALLLVIDTDTSIKRSFKMSAKMTDGVKWKLLGFSLVFGLLNLLGLLALVVGLLVSIPVTTLAWFTVYRKLLASETPIV